MASSMEELAETSLSRHLLENTEQEELSMALLLNLTDPVRYNKHIPPPNESGGYDLPLVVKHSAYVYYVSSLSPSSTWQEVADKALKHNVVILDGEAWLAEKIWTPHIVFINEHDSSVFQFSKENVYVAVDADGNVFFNSRLRVEFYCELDLTLFPFDDQICRLKMESWTLTEKHMVLKWITPTTTLNSVEVADEFSMSEYHLHKIEVKEQIYDYPHHIIDWNGPRTSNNPNVRVQSTAAKGNVKALVGVEKGKVYFKDGNFSGLEVELHFSRVFQHYILDFYIPSFFLVITSFVSFFMDPAAAPPRVTLGTSTMLTFITLARGIEASLPKVAYIKSIEIWFFGCITFIFLSLVEFTLVHSIQSSELSEDGMRKTESVPDFNERTTTSVENYLTVYDNPLIQGISLSNPSTLTNRATFEKVPSVHSVFSASSSINFEQMDEMESRNLSTLARNDDTTTQDLERTREELRKFTRKKNGFMSRIVSTLFRSSAPKIVVLDEEDSAKARRNQPKLTPKKAARIIDRYCRPNMAPTSSLKDSFLKWRGLFVVLGGFLIHLSLGSVYSFGNLTTYLTSYLNKRTDPGWTYEKSTWIFSASMMGLGGFMVLGGYMNLKLGPRITAIVGCSLATSYKKWHIQCDLDQWFPDKRGLVTGIIVGGFGLGSFVATPIQTAILNPENFSVDPGSRFFTEDAVLDRVPYVFLILGCMYACLQFVGCLCLTNPPEKKTPVVINYQSADGEAGESLEMLEAKQNLEVEEKRDASMRPKQVLCAREFYMLWFTFLFNQGVVGYINTMYKAFGQTFISNDRFLSTVGAVASICNSLGRIVWGALGDRFHYKTLMLIMTGVLGVLVLTFKLTEYGGEIMYAIWVVASQALQSLIAGFLTAKLGSNAVLYVTASFPFLSFLITAFYHKEPTPEKTLMLIMTGVLGVLVLTFKLTEYGGEIMYAIWVVASQALQSLIAGFLTAKLGSNAVLYVTASFPFLSFLITAFYHKEPTPEKVRSRMGLPAYDE
ncbi:unnamed protein product [Notodromas monacha]|uniref:Major facilitator superfamily (MFS) profile domain-containing protein n=1 Tax=Notodromas monacha TaxID=399045 RepID=A0A7R9BPX6_9CRUS|nr:unnamed protein product [Notodromas monacha]CAG0918154.1 unnamed protein product [Notodromas monacha]